VDNCSNDGTEEKIYDFQHRSKNQIKFYRVLSPRSGARNWGAKIAKGIYLLHLDSDMELSAKVIHACVSKCEDGWDAIIIPEVSISGSEYWSRCHSYEKLLSLSMQDYEAARFIKRDLFNAIGGYDENLISGEDFDLHFRIKKAGAKIGRISEVIFHHEEHLTFRSILSKYLYYSKSLPKYYIKNKELLKERIPMIYVIFAKRSLILKDPVHALGWFLLSLLNFIISRIILISHHMNAQGNEE
jgi:glycosyltransferase involved in cell wall biosynthesis